MKASILVVSLNLHLVVSGTQRRLDDHMNQLEPGNRSDDDFSVDHGDFDAMNTYEFLESDMNEMPDATDLDD